MEENVNVTATAITGEGYGALDLQTDIDSYIVVRRSLQIFKNNLKMSLMSARYYTDCKNTKMIRDLESRVGDEEKQDGRFDKYIEFRFGTIGEVTIWVLFKTRYEDGANLNYAANFGKEVTERAIITTTTITATTHTDT